MEHELVLSKNAITSNFLELVELEKNMQDQIDRVLNSCEWMQVKGRFPTNVYSQKTGGGVLLTMALIIKACTSCDGKKAIIEYFEAEGFKVTI
jgi:hypothetical protein